MSTKYTLEVHKFGETQTHVCRSIDTNDRANPNDGALRRHLREWWTNENTQKPARAHAPPTKKSVKLSERASV